jgi:hypothetical protein
MLATLSPVRLSPVRLEECSPKQERELQEQTAPVVGILQDFYEAWRLFQSYFR